LEFFLGWCHDFCDCRHLSLVLDVGLLKSLLGLVCVVHIRHVVEGVNLSFQVSDGNLKRLAEISLVAVLRCQLVVLLLELAYHIELLLVLGP